MATKLDGLELEIAHFKECAKDVPWMKQLDMHTIKVLLEKGVIQVSTVFEHAAASLSGCTVISEDQADLSNGSDTKLSSVRTSGYGGTYSAPVTNIKNKTGNLIVQVYERKQNKFYFFSIPYSAYSKVCEKSNIEIPFELDGTPRRIPLRSKRLPNWWRYEYKTLSSASNALPEPSYWNGGFETYLDATNAWKAWEQKRLTDA